MTKARARERAKAKAAQKGKKREAMEALPGQKFNPGKFNPEASTIKSPKGNNSKNFGGAKRSVGRSK